MVGLVTVPVGRASHVGHEERGSHGRRPSEVLFLAASRTRTRG